MGRTSAIANLVLLLAPLAAGLLLAVMPPALSPEQRIFLLIPIVCAVGGLLILAAKFARFRSGHWVTFGPVGLPTWARIAYGWGYALLAFGALSAFFVAARW